MHKQIDSSSERSVIGVSNGVHQVEVNVESVENAFGNIAEKTFYYVGDSKELKHQEKLLKSTFPVVNGKLLDKAKLTDFMVFTPRHFGVKYIISQKVLDIFNKVEVNKNEYRALPISIENIKEKYFLLFTPEISTEQINFKNSKIIRRIGKFNFESKKIEFIINTEEFNSYDEYRNSKNFTQLDVKQVNYSKAFKKNDILHDTFSYFLFFSERLVQALNQANVTNLLVNEDVTTSFD